MPQVNDNYNIYYELSGHKQEGGSSLFPYFISVNNEYAVTVSRDMNKAVLYSRDTVDIIDMMNQEFDTIVEDSLKSLAAPQELIDLTIARIKYFSIRIQDISFIQIIPRYLSSFFKHRVILCHER